MGRGNAMTAVVLCSSNTWRRPPCRCSRGTQIGRASSQYAAACLPRGTPNATMRGHPADAARPETHSRQLGGVYGRQRLGAGEDAGRRRPKPHPPDLRRPVRAYATHHLFGGERGGAVLYKASADRPRGYAAPFGWTPNSCIRLQYLRRPDKYVRVGVMNELGVADERSSQR